MNIEKAINEFNKYTDTYKNYGDMIDLKINHTYRVMDLCEELAISLNLTNIDVEISKLIGLLHDIGRFEQWMKYKTFSDKESIDHADLGLEILKSNDYIRKYIEEDTYDEIILNSIKYHNKYRLPNNLDDRKLMFSKLIRDADKIDILYLYTTKEISLELDTDSFSDNIFNSLLNRKDIKRSEIKTKTDRLSVSLGFIFDINYRKSIEILKERKYIDIIINHYQEKTNSEILKNQLEEIKKVINNYIEERLESC